MARRTGLTLDFKSCAEVDAPLVEQTFDEGTEPTEIRARVMRLLERMARVAKPGDAAHRVLDVLARLARVNWLTGTLDVALRDFGVATEIDIRVDEGKRIGQLRTLSLAVPLAELRAYAEANPAALEPLYVFGRGSDGELRLRVRRVAPPRGRAADVHSRATVRVPRNALPPEAYRSPQSEAPVAPSTDAGKAKGEPPDPEGDGGS